MTSQIGEREDHVIVDDLRSESHPLIRNDDVIDKRVFEIFLDNCFGPLHFSRLDLVTMSIMRGRDHGLNDYNSVRAAYGLDPVETWRDINPDLFDEDPHVSFVQSMFIYG